MSIIKYLFVASNLHSSQLNGIYFKKLWVQMQFYWFRYKLLDSSKYFIENRQAVGYLNQIQIFQGKIIIINVQNT